MVTLWPGFMSVVTVTGSVAFRDGHRPDRLRFDLTYPAGGPMSVVLITGCSTGIGLQTAVAFARNGDTVVATMRNPAKADRLQKAAADAGVEVQVVALDVTSDASAQSAVAEVLGRHGRIDVLVNNAGVGLSGPVEDFPD